jgi:hypothetical protein
LLRRETTVTTASLRVVGTSVVTLLFDFGTGRAVARGSDGPVAANAMAVHVNVALGKLKKKRRESKKKRSG